MDRIGGMGVIMQDNNTIAGIASGMGGGIGIIRVSGNKALEITGKIFRTKKYVDKKMEKCQRTFCGIQIIL